MCNHGSHWFEVKGRVKRRGIKGKLFTVGGLIMNRAFMEGTDYLLDMEMSMQNKKRRRGEALYTAENVALDEEYGTFLEGLYEFWEAKFVEEDDNDDDPTYVAFLENLKEYGNAYMLDVSYEHGILFPVKYEVENESPNEIKRKTSQSRSGTCNREKKTFYQDGDLKSIRKKSSAKNDSFHELRRSLHVNDDPKSGVKNSDSRKYHSHGIKRKTLQSRRGDRVRENRSLDVDSDQRSGPKYSDFGKKMSIVVDEAYGNFLKSLYVSEESVFYEYGDQERVFYEPSGHDVGTEPLEKDTSSPLLTLRPSTPNLGLQTPPSRTKITMQRKPIPTDVNNILRLSNETCKNREKSGEICSSYWKKTGLYDYLRKPYSITEYDNLWKEVSTRRPVMIHRESRSGGSDRQGRLGKSYLDSYPDLLHEINKVKSDSPKVLNLLRMCIFYLQKIPAIPSGVPMPWKDDLTKSILPERLG